MIHIALCDADADACRNYKEFISSYMEDVNEPCDITVFDSGEKLLVTSGRNLRQFDIVFIDPELPGRSGIDIAETMRADGYEGVFVFIADTVDYVFDAFDVGALNYVIKDAADSAKRMNRIMPEAIEQVKTHGRQCILINGISEHRYIPIDSIEYFEVRKHIVSVYYDGDKEFNFISTLGKIANRLAAYGFIQTYRSIVVNCRKVERYNSRTLHVVSGSELPIGRKYLAQFKQAMVVNSVIDIGVDDGDE